MTMNIRTSSFRFVCKSVCLSAAVFCSAAYADTFNDATLHTSQSDFGGVGLMQMPTGRVAPEGEFNLGGTFNQDYYHGFVSLQLMPWLETTIRYTQVQDMLFNSNYDYSGDNEYTDKGMDFKARLLKESDWIPETSIGIRDFGGTGLFDGEFVAATKRFGNLDFTLGIGWGYLGTRDNISNPFCKASDTYCTRDDTYKNNGGSVDYERWFKGPTAIFGGVEYQTPYQPLRFKLEYDSNDYSEDYPVTRGGKDLAPHTPWNVGVLYALQGWGDFRVSYERGDTLTVGVNLHSNFNDMHSTWRDTPKAAYKPRANSEQPDWQQVARQINDNAGYAQNSISTSGTNITVQGEPEKYRTPETAHERTALILSQNRSDEVTTYTFVEQNRDLTLKTTHYDADKFDAYANSEYTDASFTDALLPEGSKEKQFGEMVRKDNRAPKKPETQLASYQEPLSYGIAPTLTQSFGGPEGFYLYSLGVTGSASYRLTNNLELSSSLYLNLADNYDKFNYIEDDPHIDNFAVPRVRTLFRYYVHDNPLRMNDLQLTWFEQLNENIYFQGYGGYLESMFAGVGGEVLYRQQNSNWAISADVNLVSQRDPNSWFSVYSDDYFEFDSGCEGGVYTTSCAAYVLSKGTTGFVNLYYMPKWELLRNTKFKVGFGQFLGQDKGVRADFSKQFDSGVIAGAYASYSDLTADEYGEGSFTKGFYISFPLDILTVKPSRNRASFNWQPITRDGGQTLNRKYELFEVTDSRSPWFTKPVSH
ncbi:YjbH domain-containing protein [Vibrio sp. VB16]|uniref:YjbH domain-containing protein n=1 Tax=Vibrio sp. VB16 TaxID=2785746 RepID=UPI00189D171E|nr:YjbH domain-containing protein [Vibrio sp. VB16]UGA57371.1 YjbH domain-containing protein [Vibrio sp. VB16]